MMEAGHLAIAMKDLRSIPPESPVAARADALRTTIVDSIPARLREVDKQAAQAAWGPAHDLLDELTATFPENASVDDAQHSLDAKHPWLRGCKTSGNSLERASDVRRKFNTGHLKEARELADLYGPTDDEIQKLALQIAEFQVANQAFQSTGDVHSAEAASRLDQEIGGGHSVYTGRFSRRVP